MKVVLTIAGSDSSGGAGIQADLKTFEAFGVFGTSALTVLTAQNTTGVTAIEEVPAPFVKAQLEAINNDFEIAAVKVGMLFSKTIIETVAAFLDTLDAPIVIDPVCISKAGSPLLQDDALAVLPRLFSSATVITPNRYEAEKLFGFRSDDAASLDQIAAMNLPVLVKNQTAEADGTVKSVDQFVFGDEKRIFETPYVETNNLHGTGCSFSSAIAANLALGYRLEDAISRAKAFIHAALVAAPAIGHGPGPINHKKGGEDVA